MSISNDLRQAVLQAAIQGKLTKQLPEDGNAKDLLEQIKAEKAKLIKEGKLKKEKPLPEITEDEKPFDIPENWEWVRLGCLGTANIGLTYKPSNIKEYGIIVLRSSNIQNGRMCYEDIVKVDLEIPESKMCKIGDILICARNGSKRLVGKAALIDEDGMTFGAFMAIYRSMCNPYVLNVINSEYFRRSLLGDVGTTTINQITQDMLKSAVIPLPPLSEQKRIVAKVEELMAKIDELEKTEQELEALKKAFPADMKASLLQAAMQGKLTEQLPEDGNAKDLLEQIKAEKAKLIEEGKLKKEKALPEITEDEKPFDIPENWEWVRLGEVFNVVTGMTPLKSETKFYSGGTIPWVTSSLTSSRYIKKAEVFITKYALENTTLNLIPKNTLVVAMYGQGKTRGQVAELLIDATINQACAALGNILVIREFINFMYYFLLHNYEELRTKAEGTSQPNLNLLKIKEMLIPTPPLSEQKRIVEKLEQLLPLCDGLK